VCPEKERTRYCHALPATLAFYEELKGLKAFDFVGAVYKGPTQGLVVVPKITMQEALQFVAFYSLMSHCEVGKKYAKYFLGIHPLLSPREMVNRILLNVYWDGKGDEAKINQVLGVFSTEITCTCQCQVQRLGLITNYEALKNAFVHVQAQIHWLEISGKDLLEQAFQDSRKTSCQ
jgi:hypothetical protein